MARVAYPKSLGVIRTPWLVRSRWLTALLFTHTNSIAWSTVPRLLRNQAGFMAGGSHPILRARLRERLAAATGKAAHSKVQSLGSSSTFIVPQYLPHLKIESNMSLFSKLILPNQTITVKKRKNFLKGSAANALMWIPCLKQLLCMTHHLDGLSSEGAGVNFNVCRL
jgi:hypothetical protein